MIENLFNKDDRYVDKKSKYKELIEMSNKFTEEGFVKEAKAYVNQLNSIYKSAGFVKSEESTNINNLMRISDIRMQLNTTVVTILREKIKEIKKVENNRIVDIAKYNSAPKGIAVREEKVVKAEKLIEYLQKEIDKNVALVNSNENIIERDSVIIIDSIKSIYDKVNEGADNISINDCIHKLKEFKNKYPILKNEVNSVLRNINRIDKLKLENNETLKYIDGIKNQILENKETIKSFKNKINELKLFLQNFEVDEPSTLEEISKAEIEKYIEEVNDETNSIHTVIEDATKLDALQSKSSNIIKDIVSSAVNSTLIPQGNGESIYDVNNEFQLDTDFTFGLNSYADLISEEEDSYMRQWYEYLNDLLSNPFREFVLDKNNITNFKIVFRNPITGLSTDKETLVQINHSISSNTKPVFGIGRSSYQAVAKGVKLMAGTIVVNAFENVPLAHLHSISYSRNASPEDLPPLDMFIIPIEILNDGRFEALQIKNIKFMDLRQTDGASSGGRYYAFNFIASDFVPVDFSNLGSVYAGALDSIKISEYDDFSNSEKI